MTEGQLVRFKGGSHLTSNESTVCPVCDGSGTEGFTSTWRTVKQDTLWWLDTEVGETLGLQCQL